MTSGDSDAFNRGKRAQIVLDGGEGEIESSSCSADDDAKVPVLFFSSFLTKKEIRDS